MSQMLSVVVSAAGHEVRVELPLPLSTTEVERVITTTVRAFALLPTTPAAPQP